MLSFSFLQMSLLRTSSCPFDFRLLEVKIMQNAMTLYKPLLSGAYITRSGNSYLPTESDFVTMDRWNQMSIQVTMSSLDVPCLYGRSMVHNVLRLVCHNVLFQTRRIHNVLFLNSQKLWYIMFHKCNILHIH